MSPIRSRTLALCLAASLALHALVLFLWPAPRERGWSKPPPLEVALLRTEPPRAQPGALPPGAAAPAARSMPPGATGVTEKRAAARRPPEKRAAVRRPPATPPRPIGRAKPPEPPAVSAPRLATIESLPRPITEPAPHPLSVPAPSSVPAPAGSAVPAQLPAPEARQPTVAPTRPAEPAPADTASAGDAPHVASPQGEAAARQELARAAPQAGGVEKSPAVTPPSFNAAYLRNPPPRYPVLARRNGEEGAVTLRVRVSADGRPASVAVESSSGSPTLDRAALEAVRAWRFVPARSGAEPVEAWVLVPIVFRLDGVS